VRFLVVDPSDEFRGELIALLQKKGHSTHSVESAAAAVQTLQKVEFDVMFTELHTGPRSGTRFLVEVRKRWPRLLVVVLTGKGSVKSAVRAIQAGAFDYLQKPLNPREVLGVVELLEHQLALVEPPAPLRDPLEYARILAAEEGYEVLLVSPPPAPPLADRVSHVALDPRNPAHIREAVEEFVTPKERAAVVLAAVEELLARHREQEVAKLLGDLRALLDGKGPLAVGYDPDKITATGAIAVRASIVAADAHKTLESLSSPIRRLVLRRLAEGPCSFTQALEAAKLDDTSKIAFHLRKLLESGLVVHPSKKPYRLSDRGRGVIQILREIDHLDSEQGSGNRIFSVRSTPPPH
jgi:DNA-binding response OmpR family regulator/DNA-binding transcriptional ArsR family regulator